MGMRASAQFSEVDVSMRSISIWWASTPWISFWA